jgi:predicted transcriptional regulator
MTKMQVELDFCLMDEAARQALGEKINRQIRSLAITRNDAAARSGVSIATLRRIIDGEVVRQNRIDKLLASLGLDSDGNPKEKNRK